MIHLCLESHAVEFNIYGEKSCFATTIASSYVNYCVSILTIILPNLAHIVWLYIYYCINPKYLHCCLK